MKKVLINVEERELRIAILEDEQLVELYIESLDEKSILNNIYKGKIEDVLPGLKAAFVNVGLDRNAFLHFDDVRPDLLWQKYRELNPDMADEVPTAREALAEPIESQQDDSEDDGDRRGRRRGKRGGKKRRPDADDAYSPGLPLGVTEDDLDDDDDDDMESTPAAAPEERRPEPVIHTVTVASVAHLERADEADDTDAETPAESSAGTATSESENRRLSRAERQKQRRERWEQRKLERQQRRQQEREQTGEVAEVAEAADASPGNEVEAPVREQRRPEPRQEEPQYPPAVYGTRGAMHIYEDFNVQVSASQLRQNKQRYGDNFGNIAPPSKRRHDPRESQADFFGPADHSTADEYSIWDERQPDLGPVPGLGKAFLGLDGGRKKRMRTSGSGGGVSRTHQGSGSGQSQNRNRKPSGNTSSGSGGGGKRRGGKRRTMRKRDNRSYFAFSADEAEKDFIEQVDNTPETTEEAAPKKTTRRRKTASEDGAEAAPKATTRRTAAKKTTTTRTTKAKAAAKDEAPELPLDINAEGAAGTVAPEDAVAEKPKKTTRRTTTTRTRKKAVEEPEKVADPVKTNAEEQKAAPAEKVPAEKAPVAKTDEPVAKAEEPAVEPAVSDEKAEPASVDKIKEEAPAASVAEEKAADATEVPGAAEADAPPLSAKSSEVIATESNVADATPDSTSEAVPTPSGDQAAASAPAPSQSSGRSRDRFDRNGRSSRSDRDNRRDRNDRNKDRQERSADRSEQTADRSDQSSDRNDRGGDRNDRSTDRVDRNDRSGRQRPRKPQFQEVFRKGDEIMVQVVKEEIGMKGARISSYVSLPGRYLVLLPYPNQEGGISRKVEDIKERKRLKSLLKDISSDETAFIVRTAGLYQEEREIRNDVEFLTNEWKAIAERHEKADAGGLVYDDHDILYRLARDVFDENISEILIDSHVESEKLKTILEKLIPGLVDKVKLYSGAENIFHKYGVTKQIQKAARRKVWLKSGGYLIIDEAEALTAIDVNTGKSVGKDNQEKLILRTNIEAARAVARELKLRDIGGLIVIDFIDMKDARNRDQVLSELKMQLRKDRSKTSVSAISEFGLVEMTRKRVRRSLRKTIFMDCPYCQGAGVVLSEQQIWLHMKHEVVRQLESARPAPTLNITVNPKIRAYVDQNYRDVIRRLEQKYDTEIRITMSDVFHIENYQIEKLETTGVIKGSATVVGG